MTDESRVELDFDQRPSARGSHDWARISALLRANPGKWALAFTNERYSIAVAIRNGSIKALQPKDGFRVTTRNNTRTRPRRADIYLSYQPKHDTALEDLIAAKAHDGGTAHR